MQTADHKPKRNSPARGDMLDARIAERYSRIAGYERMATKPRAFVGKVWDPRTGKVESPTRMQGVAASINRRTGKPHLHARQKARRLAALSLTQA